jgi:uncharacterized protein (TIGR04255 family)
MSAYNRPPGLPDYERPPVTEVVLSIQFAPNTQFKIIHAGLFWNLVRDQFPIVSEQAPLQCAFETFAGPAIVAAEPIQVHAFSSFPFPRFWFESEDRAYILQLQQDRILLNWRALSSVSIYPRYETLRERFMTEVQRLAEFFEGQRFGRLSPNQCEVTYINSISVGEEDSLTYSHLDRITPLWSEKARRISGLDVERTDIKTVFVLKSNEQPYGRLYVIFTPAVRTDGFLRPVIHLEMTARGRPENETLEAAFRLLDQERYAIVRAFTDVTKEEMHKMWGRTDVARF